MKVALRFSLVLALAVVCLLQSGLLAGDKKAKEPDKKNAEPAKDVVVDGELINADLKDKVQQQSFAKTYTIKLEKERTYQIELASPRFQTFLRLEDASGNPITQAVGQFGPNQRAMILYKPTKTEDHQIVATTTQAGATGKFTLFVKDASRYTILSVKDKLDGNDKGYAPAGNKRHKAFTVQLEANKTYQIDMISTAFDSYLYFESPAGKVLTQDDDSGGFPNARIIWKAGETGKFRVVCTHFGGGAVQGDFNVTVRLTDGAAPVGIPKDGAKDK